MHKHQDRPASSRQWLRRHDLLNFIATLYEGDLHAKRVLSLANATQGVLTSASLAIHAVGRGLAQAMGTLTKHGVKQVDRLLSNRGVDVWAFFAYWTPFIVAARTEVVVALDWTSFAADGQDTIVLSMVTGHGRATPLLWKTVASSTLKGNHIRDRPATSGCVRIVVLLRELANFGSSGVQGSHPCPLRRVSVRVSNFGPRGAWIEAGQREHFRHARVMGMGRSWRCASTGYRSPPPFRASSSVTPTPSPPGRRQGDRLIAVEGVVVVDIQGEEFTDEARAPLWVSHLHRALGAPGCPRSDTSFRGSCVLSLLTWK